VAIVNYMITVTGGIATVTPDQDDGYILEKGDTVTFKSNDAGTMIKYTATSPFASIPAKTKRNVGKTKKGPFEVTSVPPRRKVVVHHFDCLDGTGNPWGGRGNGTPVGGGN
jgi:hypothetical protein